MKNKFIKYYIAFLYFFSTCLSFAQPGSGITDGTSTDVADAPTSPIDSYLWVMMGIGLLFAFYKVKSRTKRIGANSVC